MYNPLSLLYLCCIIFNYRLENHYSKCSLEPSVNYSALCFDIQLLFDKVWYIFKGLNFILQSPLSNLTPLQSGTQEHRTKFFIPIFLSIIFILKRVVHSDFPELICMLYLIILHCILTLLIRHNSMDALFHNDWAIGQVT